MHLLTVSPTIPLGHRMGKGEYLIKQDKVQELMKETHQGPGTHTCLFELAILVWLPDSPNITLYKVAPFTLSSQRNSVKLLIRKTRGKR